MAITFNPRKNTQPLDPEKRGIAKLNLADRVPVFELQLILAAIHDIYTSHVWIGKVRELPEGQMLSKDWEPEERDTLLVRRSEIGTPNFIELIGDNGPLLNAVVFVSTVLGIGTISFNWRKTMAETEKIKAETEKIKLEVEKIRAEKLNERAEQLFNNGKIDEEDYEYKKNVESYYSDRIRNRLGKIKQTITEIEYTSSEPVQ